MNMVCILENFLLLLVLRLGSILGAQSFSSLSPLMDSVLKTSMKKVYFQAILSGNVGGEKKQDNKSDKKKAQEVASSEDEDEDEDMGEDEDKDMGEDESEGQEVDDED